MKVYSLYDTKVCEFGGLVVAPNDESVLRGLAETFRQGGRSTLMQYPEDFNLYLVGEFNPETGVLVAESPTKLVVNCASVAKQAAE